jgi:hypothetical protein
MTDYLSDSYAAAYRSTATPMCLCGHNESGHNDGVSRFCLGWNMSGGACGMQQQCACRSFIERTAS